MSQAQPAQLEQRERSVQPVRLELKVCREIPEQLVRREFKAQLEQPAQPVRLAFREYRVPQAQLAQPV
ncbi:hypothetical protein K380107A5_18120 [Holdemania massiliensis]